MTDERGKRNSPGLWSALGHKQTRAPLLDRVFRGPGRALVRAWQSSRLYQRSLSGKHSDLIDTRPFDPWDGDLELADLLFKGVYRFGDCEFDRPGEPPWEIEGAPAAFVEEVHGFGWLRHFSAADKVSRTGPTRPSAARAHIHGLMALWLKDYGARYDPIAWAPHVTARRIISFTEQFPLLVDLAEPVYRSHVMSALWRQARHLSRCAHRAPPGYPRIVCAIGLVHAGLAFSRHAKRVEQGLSSLSAELGHQILADGGHESASPVITALILADLIALKETLDRAQIPAPDTLSLAIDRMVPFVRMMQLGDRALAQMNGARAQGFGPAGSLASSMAMPPVSPGTLVLKSGVNAKALNYAPHSGYARAEAGRTTLLMDATQRKRTGFDPHAHGGTGCFELSAGSSRIIVNCGPPQGLDDEWHEALRGTAAHSALTIEGRSHTRFFPAEGPVGEALGPVIADGPREVTLERKADGGHVLMTVTHDGYGPDYGFRTAREIYFGPGGGDIRGEDRLMPLSKHARAGVKVTVRFHLHPSVSVSPTGGGDLILLNPPTGPGWYFRSRGGRFGLARSVYAGSPGKPRRTQQIVLEALTSEEGLTLSWGLKRFDRPKKDPEDT